MKDSSISTIICFLAINYSSIALGATLLEWDYNDQPSTGESSFSTNGVEGYNAGFINAFEEREPGNFAMISPDFVSFVGYSLTNLSTNRITIEEIRFDLKSDPGDAVTILYELYDFYDSNQDVGNIIASGALAGGVVFLPEYSTLVFNSSLFGDSLSTNPGESLVIRILPNSLFDAGTPIFGYDNIRISGTIPEPSITLLSCLSILGFLRRRQRA